MRNSEIFLAALVPLVFVVSCNSGARIDCAVSDAPESEVIVKRLEMSSYKVLDTVKTNAGGKFSYRVPVEKGQPEFIYLFRGDRRIASLLLEAGDRVKVETDTLGHCSVPDSRESSKLIEVEKSFSVFMTELQKLASLPEPPESAISRLYVEYYRSRVKYLLDNPGSMTVIPVLYQKINEYTPVFSQKTDAIHFRNACDSLKAKYPESRYVKALEKETERRERILAIDSRITESGVKGFPDIVAYDMSGKKSALSEVKSKVVLLHFWDPSDVAQKMFNIEVLKPLYDTFHSRGMEIYSVAISSDKAFWASVVKAQKLPWINVCDTEGTQSVYNYNINTLPVSVIISDGILEKTAISDVAGLRRELNSLL